MIDRTPPPRDQRPALPAFDPVPRQCKRHDGWTPERQRAFIEALADTGSVATAARMVNMSSESAYLLRRHPQATGFAAAWEAATNMGWRRLKDEAFERALNGQLVPVFTAGKLIGYRRKKNDRLLMFILRHYGPDGPAPGARPLTVNVFNGSATAIAQTSPGQGEEASAQRVVKGGPDQTFALRSTPTPQSLVSSDVAAPPHSFVSSDVETPPHPFVSSDVETPPHSLVSSDVETPPHPFVSSDVETPPPDHRDIVATFAGVPLDDEAQAQILAALTANAARQRSLPIEEDPAIPFIHAGDAPAGYLGEMEAGVTSDDTGDRQPGEVGWQMLGDEEALAGIDAAVAAVRAAKANGELARPARAPRRKPAVPPALPAPREGRIDAGWATPDEQRQLAGIDALIEAAKAEVRQRRK